MAGYNPKKKQYETDSGQVYPTSDPNFVPNKEGMNQKNQVIFTGDKVINKGNTISKQEYEQLQAAKRTGATDIGTNPMGLPNVSLSEAQKARMQEANVQNQTRQDVETVRQQQVAETQKAAVKKWEVETGRAAAPMSDVEIQSLLTYLNQPITPAPVEQQGLNPLELVQAGTKMVGGIAGGAASLSTAGAGIGAALTIPIGGAGALPGAVIGGIIGGIGGGIVASNFVISQIKENEKQDVKAVMSNYSTATKNMNNLVNMANQGRPATEVMPDFREQEQIVRDGLANLEKKSSSQIGEDLAKSLDEQAKIRGFLDFELPYIKQKLVEAIASPDPNKIIYNTQTSEEVDTNG